MRRGRGNQLLRINGPDLRRIIMDIAPILIKQERLAASERTREKLAIKAEGKRLGRPRSSEVKRRLIELAEKGVTLKEACRMGLITAQP
jgi:DNA invertase Pin-like site-specific DNA recombinase